MDHSAIFVLTWACVAVFIATAIVTLLALVGYTKLGGGDGSRHDFYLKALFAALILEVVGISVTAYASALKSPGQLIAATKDDKGAAAAAPATNTPAGASPAGQPAVVIVQATSPQQQNVNGAPAPATPANGAPAQH